jgi:lysophospholipase L1-like esterase
MNTAHHGAAGPAPGPAGHGSPTAPPRTRGPRRRAGCASALTLAAAVALTATAAIPTPAGAAPRHPVTPQWVATWQGAPVVGTAVPGNSCPAGAGLAGQTVRNAVFVSAGGSSVRVRLTNAFGTAPVTVGHASVAVQASGAVPVGGTTVPLTFGGQRSVTVPAGQELFSDPVKLGVTTLSTLLVSVHVPAATGPVTNHPFTTNTSFLGTGDLTASADPAAFTATPCWMLVDGVDVDGAQRPQGAVVALGDSITDTANTKGDANDRWTDDLSKRLADPAAPADRPSVSVVNAGLGGNRLLAPRDEPFYGVPALDRLDRDVFAQSGVRSVVVFEGINDIGFDASADDIIGAYKKIIEASHAHGLKVIGATLTPFRASFVWTDARGRTWQQVNDWIRGSGGFDDVIDFAAATAAPDDPFTLAPAYDSGDGLHPNDAGTRAMADSINLSVLSPGPVTGSGHEAGRSR